MNEKPRPSQLWFFHFQAERCGAELFLNSAACRVGNWRKAAELHNDPAVPTAPK